MPLVSPSQTVLGSWLHVDDVVIATNQPEETLQAVAAAINPPDPQVNNLESADVNNPDPEVDTLETGTSGSSTPHTQIHYSDVD